MNGELTITYFSVDRSEQIPSRHRDSAALSDTKMTRVNDSECAGITGHTPNDFGFG
jgi:hypothetical protein